MTPIQHPPLSVLEVLQSTLRAIECTEGVLDTRTRREIASVGLRLVITLVRKNTDYGDSACSSPILAPNLPVELALLARMSDKVARLRNLAGGIGQADESVPYNESLNDTLLDLAGYCLLMYNYRLNIKPNLDNPKA